MHVLACGQVDKRMLVIHLVRFGRSRVWIRNIMTTVIITEIHHIMRRMDHVRFVRMIGLIGVLRLPDDFIMRWELTHMFHLRFKSKDLFLHFCR